jgi:hypothetical protein
MTSAGVPPIFAVLTATVLLRLPSGAAERIEEDARRPGFDGQRSGTGKSAIRFDRKCGRADGELERNLGIDLAGPT